MTEEANIPDNDPRKKPSGDDPEMLFAEIDDYQQRMVSDWETAKDAYKKKIDEIMTDFVKENIFKITDFSTPEPEEPRRPEADVNSKKFWSNAEKALRDSQEKTDRLLKKPTSQTLIAAPHRLPAARRLESPPVRWSVAGLAAAVGMGFFFLWAPIQRVTLPYTHTGPLVLTQDRVYVVDWFRQALYVHARKTGLPLLSVESLPNDLISGLAVADKNVWTADGTSGELLKHTATPDHRVLERINVAEGSASLVFWDGKNLWSVDEKKRLLRRHSGEHADEVAETFALPDTPIAAFYLNERRLWSLDKKARLIRVYRLQDNPQLIATFDLDPFLKDATPTSLWVDGRTVWLTTENPAGIMQIPRAKLQKSAADKF